MSIVDINWHPSPRELRVFAGLQWLFCGVVSFYLWRQHEALWTALCVMSISSLLAVGGLLAPRALRPVYVAWMLAVFPIGWIVSHLVLAAVYYLVFTPVGFALRLMGHDPLERRWDRAASSYWKARPQPPEPSRYFREF